MQRRNKIRVCFYLSLRNQDQGAFHATCTAKVRSTEQVWHADNFILFVYTCRNLHTPQCLFISSAANAAKKAVCTPKTFGPMHVGCTQILGAILSQRYSELRAIATCPCFKSAQYWNSLFLL